MDVTEAVEWHRGPSVQDRRKKGRSFNLLSGIWFSMLSNWDASVLVAQTQKGSTVPRMVEHVPPWGRVGQASKDVHCCEINVTCSGAALVHECWRTWSCFV